MLAATLQRACAALQALQLAGASVATTSGERVRRAERPPGAAGGVSADTVGDGGDGGGSGKGGGNLSGEGGGDGGVERTYLKAHSTHCALLVDHPDTRLRAPRHACAFPADGDISGDGDSGGGGGRGGGGDSGGERGGPGGNKARVFAAIRHFNFSHWEVAVQLIELLLTGHPDDAASAAAVAPLRTEGGGGEEEGYDTGYDYDWHQGRRTPPPRAVFRDGARDAEGAARRAAAAASMDPLRWRK